MKEKKMKTKIGFIGQGFVGKNHADDFERRGYKVTRYSLEKEYINNGDLIKNCDVVFIATPTPTTPNGFDYSTINEAIGKVGKGKIAVVKSTILPGTTEVLQKNHPQKIVLHSPEFLSEATAARDAAFPTRNIVGAPVLDKKHRDKAQWVLDILPTAPYNKICHSVEAEIIKYGRNTMGFVRIVFANILYDISQSVGANWSVIQEAMSSDPDNGPTYMSPLHKSGRGAGGHCFIKDFAALRQFSEEHLRDDGTLDVFTALEKKILICLKVQEKTLIYLEVFMAKRLELMERMVEARKENMTSYILRYFLVARTLDSAPIKIPEPTTISAISRKCLK